MAEQRILINVWNLEKSYGRLKALAGVSFSIPNGQITGFLGPNGAGKSTTIKCLLGLIRRDKGVIEFNGEEIRDPSRLKFRIRTGALLENHAFFPRLSARENLVILALCDRMFVDESVIEELLQSVGLDTGGKQKVRTLSRGMCQKLAVASALLNNPEILILDEPFSGLDPNAIDQLSNTLKEYSAAGGTVFVSSHHLAEVEGLCDRVVIIHRGKIVQEGSLAELTAERNLKSIYMNSTGSADD